MQSKERMQISIQFAKFCIMPLQNCQKLWTIISVHQFLKANPLRTKTNSKNIKTSEKTSFSDGIPLTKCKAMKNADFNPICQILHHTSTKLSKTVNHNFCSSIFKSKPLRTKTNSKNIKTSEKPHFQMVYHWQNAQQWRMQISIQFAKFCIMLLQNCQNPTQKIPEHQKNQHT